jgi:plastocyanin
MASSPATRRVLRALPAALAALALASCAGPVQLSGRVTLPAREARAGGAADVVVWLEDSPAVPAEDGGSAAGPGPARLEAGPRGFAPRVAVLSRGGTLTLFNRDRVYHQPFAMSSGTRTEFASIAPGAADSARFAREGALRMFCALHEHPPAWVVVVPNRWVARPDATGAWTLPPLPKGQWKLRAWHPTLGERAQTVRIEGRRAPAVDLRY